MKFEGKKTEKNLLKTTHFFIKSVAIANELFLLPYEITEAMLPKISTLFLSPQTESTEDVDPFSLSSTCKCTALTSDEVRNISSGPIKFFDLNLPTT